MKLDDYRQILRKLTFWMLTLEFEFGLDWEVTPDG